MDTHEALAALGLPPGVAMVEVRAAYRRLVRTAHPDVAGPGSADRAAQLTQAYAVLRQVAATSVDGTIVVTTAAATPAPPAPAAPGAPRTAYDEAVEADLADGDTLMVRAPWAEAFAALFEAASVVGNIGYVDRQLGIIESIVRFEGGPSCSLVITLQGRMDGTEAFCTLESLEAAPTPALRPVVEALVEALTARP